MHLFVSKADSSGEHLNVKNLLGEKSKIMGVLDLIARVAGLMHNKNRALSQ